MKTVIAITLLCISSVVVADDFPTSKVSATDAAQKIVDYFPRTNRDLMDSIGFEGGGESQARLGKPIEIYRIDINRLKTLTKGDCLRSVLSRPNVLLFPITVRGEVKSSLSVEKANGEWSLLELGRPEFIRTLDYLRGNLATDRRASDNQYFFIEIRGTSLKFLAYLTGSDVTFVPVFDYSELSLRANVPVSGQDLIEPLSTFAKNHKPLLPRFQ